MSSATTPPEPVYIDVDADVTYEDARTRVAGAELTTGTCTFAWYEANRTTAVAGGTGSLSHVSGGDYLGVTQSTVTATFTRGRRYWCKIVFEQGSYNDTRWLEFEATLRGNT